MRMPGLATLALLFFVVPFAAAKPCVRISAVPAVIDAPGKYCLAANSAMSTNADPAIEIAADHVDLDFDGATLQYTGNYDYAMGVSALNRSHVHVYGGTIRGFATGLDLQSNIGFDASKGNAVTDMTMEDNRMVAIVVMGADTLIADNVVQRTGGWALGPAVGILAFGKHARVQNNRVVDTFAISDYLSAGIMVYAAKDCRIEKNEVLDTTAPQFSVGAEISYSPGCDVKKNTFDNSGTQPLWAGIERNVSAKVVTEPNEFINVVTEVY